MSNTEETAAVETPAKQAKKPYEIVNELLVKIGTLTKRQTNFFKKIESATHQRQKCGLLKKALKVQIELTFLVGISKKILSGGGYTEEDLKEPKVDSYFPKRVILSICKIEDLFRSVGC